MESQISELTRSNKRKRPIKPFFNVRAHTNPLADNWFENTPIKPSEFNWRGFYPEIYEAHNDSESLPRVEMADIGCGFGGLLFSLSPMFPETLILGIEIREKVVEYVSSKILEHRKGIDGAEPSAKNIAVLRTNAMKFLPNLFEKGQLLKLFFLFPDPHFKKNNHRRRIISTELLSEYAYVLKEGGRLYTISDVKELYDWEVFHLDAHPLFKRISDEETAADKVAQVIISGSEEGKKVEKNQGEKWMAVYERIAC